MNDETGRLIFRYHDGRQEVAADPALLWRRYRRHVRERHGGDIQPVLEILNNGPTAVPEDTFEQAVESVVALAEVTFDQKRLKGDGQGMTELELQRALAQFMRFLADSKKKAEPSPNGSITAGPPDASPAMPSGLA